MKSDHDLMALAAKAANITVLEERSGGLPWSVRFADGGERFVWAPLHSDGDNRRLQVALGITLGQSFDGKHWEASHRELQWVCYEPATNEDAARRAVVRIAADLAAR